MGKLLGLVPYLIAVGAAWSLGFVYNVYYGGELSWLRQMYKDKMAIAAQIQAPRRLLVTGGSGAHYTIDSKALERGLGIPVVNLGLDGPVGLDVILPSVIDQVRSGDIVLLIPEYLILLDDNGLGDRSASFGVAIARPGLGGIPPKELAQEVWLLGIPSLRALTKSAVDLVERGKMTGYYSDPVSDRGDPTVTKVRVGQWWQLPIDSPISSHAIERISQFRQEVEATGGKLILSLPWVYASKDEKTIASVKKTAQELAKIAPLIYEKDSLNLKTDSSLFADTHYHLLPEARKIRAQQLVEQLKPLIGVDARQSETNNR
ncbi:MAG: hypothetical protein IGR93_11475 [Hydrococcus sp. C42_A2020_068]|uniref:hypothetical protein n=1 Tax=Pleurocapsa sp. PCC 7327 TaxID=118163 RepID=UPI00029F9E79|nr:hypothetical protein [Pleurocapsa sp. PCC 7327]AFY79195.1 hypothetical protein Ple7327_4054 [Pleurocapsa sp. PCC 7327]MBF2020694.1 hypothetical protein [Hydrococcus sp. C42_A2020_068]